MEPEDVIFDYSQAENEEDLDTSVGGEGENGDTQQYPHLIPPQHKTVLALKRQSRRESQELNRMSNSSLDSQGSAGGDGISISDSCCESFSSSEPNVNVSPPS